MVSVSYQAVDLKRRRKKLEEDEDEVDRQIEVGHIPEKRDYIHPPGQLSTPCFSTSVCVLRPYPG